MPPYSSHLPGLLNPYKKPSLSQPSKRVTNVLPNSPPPSPMVPELEKPQITEIRIRMDCNGCVQKIKKALRGINGIYDIYFDFPQQKLMLIGWTDLEKIIKAIKKTRKIFTICTHTEFDESIGFQAQTIASASKDDQSTLGFTKTTPTSDPRTMDTFEHEDIETMRIINYYHPHNHSYSEQFWNSSSDDGMGRETPDYNTHNYHQHEAPDYVAVSYDSYKPSAYVSENRFSKSPPQNTQYHTINQYRNVNTASMFSDENPNACVIA